MNVLSEIKSEQWVCDNIAINPDILSKLTAKPMKNRFVENENVIDFSKFTKD